MTRQTWTAVAAGIAFAVSVAILALVGVPFVVWSPGSTTDLLAQRDNPPVVISGTTTFPTKGHLLVTNVEESAPDAKVSLIEALYGFWSSDRDVLPWSAVYPPGATAVSVDSARSEESETARADAIPAALQAAMLPIKRVPIVLSVSDTGPAAGRLQYGDIVVSVDKQAVETVEDVTSRITAHKPGEAVRLEIRRNRQSAEVYVNATSSTADAKVAVVGAKFGLGYSYDTNVTFVLNPSTSDSSAGLMLSLAVYAKVSSDPLVGDRIVAGAGRIDGSGAVSPVSGIRQRVLAAERAGATVFLIPKDNCADLGDRRSGMRLVRVSTVAGAVVSLTDLADPAKEANVKGCS